MQAMRGLEASTEGVPVAALLGGMQRREVPTYANVNRRTLDRSPEGFAASVSDAVAAGHVAFKIAPFDDLTPDLDAADARPLIAQGIARIEAVRDAIGPEKRLMVDCHWRFQADWAMAALDALKPVGLHWFECPVPDTEAMIPDLVRIRAAANRQGVLLAGMENAILRRGFQPFLEARAFDVMMPDVKYAGGPDEMMRIAEEFAAAGVTFSPHNPSGPICHGHSLQICAAVPDLAVLETQYDETPLFDELVGSGLPPAEDGIVHLSDSAAGIGVSLYQGVLDALETRILWQAAA
jgi:galactonate dehydratase